MKMWVREEIIDIVESGSQTKPGNRSRKVYVGRRQVRSGEGNCSH